MATEPEIETLLKTQLNNDSRAQLLAAGAGWKTFPMGFYYSDEISVDLGVKATMLSALTLEHAQLATEFWENLRTSIDRSTIASDAITIINQIASNATH